MLFLMNDSDATYLHERNQQRYIFYIIEVLDLVWKVHSKLFWRKNIILSHDLLSFVRR